MENLALIESFSEFKDDKFTDRVTLMAILEEVFRNALKKKFGSDDNCDIIINPVKGDMEIWQRRVIVADDDLDLDHLEITLSEARQIEPDFEIGEEVSQEVKLKDLVGDIYTAEVHHVRPRVVILVDDQGNEIVLPKEKQIPSDFFRKGDNVRGIIESVELKGNKPQIIMSRTSEKFLEKLFEQEIPEVFDGLIMVKKVVRIPGEKAKVAVDSYDDRIDPVGACVGMKGSRIHGIVRELGNENIDVINYTSNIQLYITRALSPAKVSSIKIDEESKKAEVFLKLEEVSKAIGRGGHNIKLAGLLSGYELDVIREGNIAEEEDDVELTEFSDEIEGWIIDEFAKIGLDTARSILNQDVADLVRRTDLEEETILDVIKILKEELNS